MNIKPEQKIEVVTNPYAEEEMLKLAENPEISSERLHLILDSDIDVFENHDVVILSALAKHPNLSTKDLFNILGFAVGHYCQKDRQICEVNLQSEVIRSLNSKEIELKDYKHLSKDEDWFVRGGVAAYTKTPSEVLKKLAENEEFDETIVFNVAKNPNTDLATLLMIEGQEVFFSEDHQWIYEGLAQNPSSPEDLLLRLANDEYFREGKYTFRESIAGNKGASLPMLYFLLSGENRDVQERVLANPNFRKVTKTELMEFPNFARIEIAGSSSIDSEYFEMLLDDPSFEIQERLLLNPRVLDEKLNEWQIRAREYLLQIDEIVRSSDNYQLQTGGLSALTISDESIKSMLEYGEEWFYALCLKFDAPMELLFLAANIAGNQPHFLGLTPKFAQQLLFTGIQLKLERESLAATTRESLDVLGNLEIRYGEVVISGISTFLAINEITSDDLLDKLSRIDDVDILQWVAQNQSAGSSTYEHLALSGDEMVIFNLSENPSVPVHVLDTIVRQNIQRLDVERIAFAIYLIALNPKLSKEGLRILSEVDDLVIRDAVAENPNTDEEVLNKLFNQDDLNLKLRVLARLKDDSEAIGDIYTQILQSANTEQLTRLARYSKLPKEVQGMLAEHQVEQVRSRLAKNPILDSKLQLKLARDKSNEVKTFLSFNLSCTPEARSVLIADASEDIRYYALLFASNPQLILQNIINIESLEYKLLLLQEAYFQLCMKVKLGEI